MRILYALCTWGLGHATRSLPVIRALLREGHEVGIMSSGRALSLLRAELGDSAEYHDIPDYPAPYASTKLGFYAKFGLELPSILRGIKREHEYAEKFVSGRKYRRIISDNRYGVYSTSIPSYLITHQLRFIAPGRMAVIESAGERFVARNADKFRKFIVPDDEEGTLSGELSRNQRIPRKKILYSGPLSDFRRKEYEQDIDLLISISGPEPQRSILERKIMESSGDFPENTVITLGKSEKRSEKRIGNAVIYTYLPKDRREEVMNRASTVLSRSGYSTLMDLAVLGKRAVFVPTPGQTEQEYLSQYHMERGTYFSMEQRNFSLSKAIEKSKEYKGIEMDGERSVERVLEEVL